MGLLSVNQAASHPGLSPIIIRLLIRHGVLPHVRPFERAVSVPEHAVDAILARWTQSCESTAPARRAS